MPSLGHNHFKNQEIKSLQNKLGNLSKSNLVIYLTTDLTYPLFILTTKNVCPTISVRLSLYLSVFSLSCDLTSIFLLHGLKESPQCNFKKSENLSAIVNAQTHFKWRMLKAPPLISSDLHLSVL